MKKRGKVNKSKHTALYIILTISAIILLLALSMVVAYRSGLSPSVLGHSGEEIEVQVTSGRSLVIKNLQQAISDGDIGGLQCQIVTRSANVVAGGSVLVTCPDGYKVTGGGCWYNDPNVNNLKKAYRGDRPLDATPAGWECSGSVEVPINDLEAYAVCCKP